MHVDQKKLRDCFVENINDQHQEVEQQVKAIESCFTEDSKVPLLANGEKNSSMFGYHELDYNGLFNIWGFGSTLPIEITYKDHEGKKYRSKVNLLLKYSEAFAGFKWQKKKKDIPGLVKQILDELES